jgi:hypothetical protein
VKFWRHLVVVAFAVAVVVVLGVVWEHSGAAGWITPPGPPNGGKVVGGLTVGGEAVGGEAAGGHASREKIISLAPGGKLPPGFHVPAGFHVVNGPADVSDRGMWFDLSQVGNLTHTLEVVAAVMAWVIVFDVARRRWRKARRARATSAGSSPGPPAGSASSPGT